jgi:biopolymer transport protein ExbB
MDYYRAITIDNTKVMGSANLTDFPVLVKITSNNDLRTTGNGGKVQNANGYDIIFSSTSDGSSPLAFDREVYDATTGKFIAHVKVPTLSHNSNTVIYLCYGDNTITTYQGGTGAWHSGYEAVFHFNEASGNALDSTANEKHHTAGGSGGVYETDALIHKGIDTEATRYFRREYLEDLTTKDYVTIEAVVKVISFTSLGMVFFHGHLGYMFLRFDSPDLLKWATRVQSSPTVDIITESGYVVDTWYHLFMRWRKTDKIYFQVNGVDISSMDVANNDGLRAENTSLQSGIATYQTDQRGDHLIDELRIITTDVGADWGKTSYNSLTDPATFYTLGAEEENSSGPEPEVLRVNIGQTGTGVRII